MNRLNIQERAKILGCMVEGNSVRATSRLTGADKKTVLRLLAEFGSACQKFHDATVRGVKSQRVQCDEIWSFVYAWALGESRPANHGRLRSLYGGRRGQFRWGC